MDGYRTPGDAPSVLFVLPALQSGGSERVASAIMNHWAGAGRRVGVVTFEAAEQAPYYPLHASITRWSLNLPAAPKPRWRAYWRIIERVRALGRVFDEARPDVIVSFLTKTNIMSLLAARDGATPIIVSERNNPRLQTFDPVWTFLRAQTYPRAYAFTTMTQDAANFYPERQRPRTRIIPNPVTLPEGWRERRGERIIVGTGRLTGQKRFHLLMDAFARVAPDFPDWRLVIWGEGELRDALEAHRASLGPVGERISMPGRTAGPGQWIETADVFVLSSEYEGWPNVVAEAMASGLPVLAFDCEFGVKELVDHERTGLLAPTGDVDALSEGLRRLLGDEPLRARLGAAAKADAARYTVEAVAGEWDALIAEAAEHARAR